MISIKIEGVKDILERLDTTIYDQGIKEATTKALLVLNREERKVTPVDTGRLRNSREQKQEQRGREVLGRLQNFREYGPIVDYRQGFVQRGIDNSIDSIKRIYNSQIKVLVEGS